MPATYLKKEKNMTPLKKRICQKCGKEFTSIKLENGKQNNLNKRKYCYECMTLKKSAYTDESLIEVCSKLSNYSQILLHFNIKNAGGNYYTLKKNIKRLNIDISHFTINGNKRCQNNNNKKYELGDYIEGNTKWHSHALRLKLISLGLKTHCCEGCGLSEWTDFITKEVKKIPIDLDHIDGNKDNNKLENLRILCPNCHRNTPTHGRRNVKAEWAISSEN